MLTARSGRLEYRGMQLGWFYDGHRALADCEACLALLAQTLPKSGEQVMSVVREAALERGYLIRAVDAPYDLRDKLKHRGYRWRPAELPNGRVWWITTRDPEAEVGWLQSEIYGSLASIPVPWIGIPIDCGAWSGETTKQHQGRDAVRLGPVPTSPGDGSVWRPWRT